MKLIYPESFYSPFKGISTNILDIFSPWVIHTVIKKNVREGMGCGNGCWRPHRHVCIEVCVDSIWCHFQEHCFDMGFLTSLAVTNQGWLSVYTAPGTLQWAPHLCWNCKLCVSNAYFPVWLLRIPLRSSSWHLPT